MTVHETKVSNLIEKLNRISSDKSDPEANESRANELILVFLTDLGYDDVAEAYKRVLLGWGW